MSEHRDDRTLDAAPLPAEQDEENAITMDKRADLAVMVAIVVFGVVMLVGAGNIRHGVIPDPIGARGMPIATALFLIIGGLVLILRRLRTWRELPGNLVVEEGKPDNPNYPATWLRPAGVAALGFFWVWGLAPLGYLIVTPIFLVGSILIMSERAWWKVVVFPLIFTLVTWYVFSQVLHIVLPLGLLTTLARQFGFTP